VTGDTVTDEELDQLNDGSVTVERLIAEIRRLQQLAGEFYADLSYMGDYLFCKHWWAEMEENPFLKKWNPVPQGSPYFPETQKKADPEATEPQVRGT
jgi:hypothetical protein